MSGLLDSGLALPPNFRKFGALILPTHVKEEREDELKLKELAGKLRNNKELAAKLKRAKPARRKDIYDCLRPHLSFRALPFWALKLK